ncbi:hypothetical protein VCR1J2_200753 [Vibrio coralliirubri]|nr:hypothetical protein VCR1J2_200753 [Vibrio coralliirubri]CDT97566.1 hypothetical protein VCR8J2_550054 [Vibrio coralliirubri]
MVLLCFVERDFTHLLWLICSLNDRKASYVDGAMGEKLVDNLL